MIEGEVKMKTTNRILSVILVMSLIISSLLTFTVKAEDIKPETETEAGRRRLPEEEKSLYEKIWLNPDGTRTLEYYGSPVKYYDKDGNILDKEYRIKETADSFVYEEDFKVIFPFSLSDGVKLIFDNEEVTVMPRNLENTKRPYLSEDGRVLTYEIDDNVSIEYLISDNGLKEYIVVKSYNGTGRYSSEIVTNGLILENNEEEIILKDPEGNIKGFIGEAIVFDKEERNNTFAEVETSLITEGRYLYTVSLTEEYLERAEYPIRIDPSITLNTTGNIEDVSIVSTTTHSGTLGVLYIGRGTSGAALRTLMRFPYLDVLNATIISAKVSVRDLMCQNTEMYVECHEYTGNSWSESTTTSWSGCGTTMVGTLYSSLNVRYGYGNNPNDSQRYDFDITLLAQKWADGDSDPEYGIIFKATNTYESSGSNTYKTFGSINYNSTGTYYKPLLTLIYRQEFYGNCVIKNVGSGLYAQSAATSPGGLVFQRSYGNMLSANWEIQADGSYYTIKNCDTGLYMGIENSSHSSGAAVKLYSSVSDNTKWTFIYTNSDRYRLECKCAENYNMSIAPTSTLDGLQLYQCSYSNDSNYLDEWEISINSYFFAFNGAYSGDPNMPPLLSYCVNSFDDAGVSGVGTVSASSSLFNQRIIRSSVAAVITHGEWDCFLLSDGDYFTSNLSFYQNRAFDFLKVMVVCACYCGDTSNGDNIIDKFYSKGIDCVIGFNDLVYIPDGNTWTKYFLEHLASGYNISNSMNYADSKVSELVVPINGYHTTTSEFRYVLGDTNITVIPQ